MYFEIYRFIIEITETKNISGIIQRLDYIKDLGVDAIWINPIYASPLVDSGYDITDHNSIHPLFGDVEDINLLIEEAHERGNTFCSYFNISIIDLKGDTA